MKKVLLVVVVVFCTCHVVFAQETGKNEVKLNLLSTAAFLYPEVTYERLLARDMGLGVSTAISLKGSSYYIFQLTPYFRGYFGKNPHANFFIEANMALTGIRSAKQQRHVADFGVGVAAGWRYLSSSGLVGEVYMGGGRTIDDRFYPRFGVSIGKRF